MNGAELPCGTVIGVQPADMDYKRKPKTAEEGSLQQQPTTSRVNHKSAESETNNVQSTDIQKKATLTKETAAVNAAELSGGLEDKNTNDEDDLDDFFASLE